MTRKYSLPKQGSFAPIQHWMCASAICMAVVFPGSRLVQADTQSETTKVTASDGEGGDNFGSSISISGNTLMVGVSRDDDGPAGEGPNGSGSVYVYTRDGSGNWGNETRLTASDAGLADWFGWSVDMEGAVAVVGAVQANPTSGEGIITGAAYAFEKDANGWSETNILAGSGQQLQYQFGDAVATDGNTIAVGNWRDRDVAANSGAVHLFERDMTTGLWVEILKLKSPTPLANEHFGDNIAMDNGVLVVSNWRERRVEDVNGFGAAYVYERSEAGDWVFQQRLIPNDIAGGDDLSYDVDIDNNFIVLGAPADTDLGTAAGAAYVFKRSSSGTWEQVQKIYGSDTVANARMGQVVAIDSGKLVIGSEDQDELGIGTGAAYLFYEDSSGAWVEQAKYLASDGRLQEHFAHSLAMDSQTVAIGAWHARVDHDRQGAAYLFELNSLDPAFCNGKFVDVFIGSGDAPTSSADVILGTAGDDVINAMGGNDTICSLGGNDIVNAGRGDDWVDAGPGNDTVEGGAGNDEIYGDSGVDILNGGPDNDEIYGEADGDFIKGNSGNDVLDGGFGVDQILGGSGNDEIHTGTGGNLGTGLLVNGGGGNDTIIGGPGNDSIRGESGNDTIYGGDARDELYGGGGNDIVNGQDGNDLLRGNGSKDMLIGGEGNDDMDGGDSDDVMSGGNGNDVMRGATGNDEMSGGAGDDEVYGGGGNDILNGNRGDDELFGGGSNDSLNGGSDADSCDGEGGSDSVISCEFQAGVP